MARSTAQQSAKDARLTRLTAGLRPVFLYIFGVSGVINILALTGAFYMMQIYDRALMSGSVPTLALISVLALGLYLFQGGLDVIRSQILHRVGARFDARVAPDIHRMSMDMPRYGFSVAEAMERGRTVDTLRNFFGGPALVALFDLPWMPVFLAFVFMLHPYLGALAIGGAVVLTLMTIVTELMTRKANMQVNRAAVQRSSVAEANARNADVIKAMGFSSNALAQFEKANQDHLSLQSGSSDVTRTVGALSKVLRMMLQSAVLGLGAYLTILGEMTAGAIIAASVASARALAPIDSTIANWKNLIAARNAMASIKQTIAALPDMPRPLQMPDPKTAFSAEGITVVAPGSGRVLLSDVSLNLEAGQALGLIGPSGGGKSSLIKALVGVWPVLRGHVRLDGADLGQWGEDAISSSFGYLPQDYTLFDTTIARNIARLGEPDPEKVIAAARAAGVHDMIIAMPDGYETELGANSTSLSGGQRQRIALARALYGDPFVVILDEPNSNLDAEGEKAVSAAIQSVRERGGIVIVVAHRPSALENVDLVGVIQDGSLARIGPKSEIMRVKPAAPANRRAPAETRPEISAVQDRETGT